MKLFLNETSPFARLVLVTAVESGCRDLDLAWVDPWSSPKALLNVNPFSIVPTLHIDSGQTLCESIFICSYLIGLANPSTSQIKAVDVVDSRVLSLLAIGKTMMEIAFKKVVMNRFFDADRENLIATRATEALTRTLTNLDAHLTPEANALQAHPTLADITLAVALDYLRFRMSDLFDAEAGPTTKAWLDPYLSRPSFEFSTPEQLQSRPDSLSSLFATTH